MVLREQHSLAVRVSESRCDLSLFGIPVKILDIVGTRALATKHLLDIVGEMCFDF